MVEIETLSLARVTPRARRKPTPAKHRLDREQVAEEEREGYRDRDRGRVAPAKGGGKDHAEHFADRAAGEAVQGRLHGAASERARLIAPPVAVPKMVS
jgi:hypothetical protein